MDDFSTLLRDDMKPVDKRDGIHSVMGWLTGQTDKVPIVLDNERPFGIINSRALMSRQLNHDAKVHAYVTPTGAVEEDASLPDVADRMAELRAPHLPVQNKKGKLEGYLSAVDVARETMPGFTAREACRPVGILAASQTMGDALTLFMKEYVDFLPVMGGNGRISGVLPRRAVLAMEFNAGSRGRKDAGGQKVSMLDASVDGFMDDAPVIVKPHLAHDELLPILEESGYAIVEDESGRFVGVVTPSTLLRSKRS